MKRFYLVLLSVFPGLFFAQTNVNADCAQSIPLCTTPSFTFFANSGYGNVQDIPPGNNISNPGTNPASANAGCLLANELNPQWLLITIGNAGFLEFVFGASNSSHPQVGFYDWAMWPYSPTACSDIQNNLLPPVRCNWNGSTTGGTGIAGTLPQGGSASNYEPPLAVQPCQQFIICISNYSGVNTLVSFQSLGTASLTCDPTCLSVTNPTVCAGSAATIIAVVTGTPGNLSYTLNPGGITQSTPTFVIAQPVSGTYTVSVSGISSLNTPFTQSAVSTVSVIPQPTVSPTFTNATCTNSFNAFNFNLGFLPVGATPAYTVIWNNIPSGVTSPTQTSGTNIPPGNYVATVVTQGSCFAVANISITGTPPQASVGLSPPGPVYSITCTQPTITINTLNASFTYTWSQGFGPEVGPSADFNSQRAGTWTISAEHPVSNCIATKTIIIGINTVVPVSAITPTYQTITCLSAAMSVSASATSPTVNFTHIFLSPTGGSLTANTTSTSYQVGGVGEFTHFLVNNVNGCRATKIFTVNSNDGFPTFQLTSAPPGFTLGCNTKSIAIINIAGGQTTPPGGPVSYTFIAPGGNTVTPSGSLSAISTRTITVPGIWTAITKDNVSFCETRTPFVVLSNTAAPGLDSVSVPVQILNCDRPVTILRAHSVQNNIGYQWNFPGTVNTLLGDTITVNTKPLAPTQTLVANYTLTLTDNNSTCRTVSVIPIYQNLFHPNAAIGNGGTASLTCVTRTIMLTNLSTSGIQGNFFPKNLPIVGYVWEGPSPQLKMQMSSTYVAERPGQYTLEAKDLNNGCTSKAVITINENRIVPNINGTLSPAFFTLDCGAAVRLTPTISTGSANLTYSWTAPPGTSLDSYTLGAPLAYSLGLYRLRATDKVNGCSGSAVMQVVPGTLTAKIDAVQSQGYAPFNAVLINNSHSSTGSASIQSVWIFGNGTHSMTASVGNVTARYNAAGVYTVIMYAGKGECLDSTSFIITVEIPSSLEIPNIFTPNGDGANDVFFLKTANLSKIHIRIVDRWGKTVYELESSTGNVQWDGRNQSDTEVPDGVYYFTLRATGRDGREFDQKGTITVMR